MNEKELLARRQELFDRFMAGELTISVYLEKVSKIDSDLETLRGGFRLK